MPGSTAGALTTWWPGDWRRGVADHDEQPEWGDGPAQRLHGRRQRPLDPAGSGSSTALVDLAWVALLSVTARLTLHGGTDLDAAPMIESPAAGGQEGRTSELWDWTGIPGRPVAS
jgi:hypothetical protein